MALGSLLYFMGHIKNKDSTKLNNFLPLIYLQYIRNNHKIEIPI